MFGFLKQKIADFGNKLKQTAKENQAEAKASAGVAKPEVLQREASETKTTEKDKVEEKKAEIKEPVKPIEAKKETAQHHEHKKEEKYEEKKAEHKPDENKIKKEETVSTETPKTHEHKTQAPKETQETKPPEKKVGLLGKLFGVGKKKEETKETHKEKVEHKKEEKPKFEIAKKKTKEEIAAELEEKMFKEIEGELKTEGVDVTTAIEEEAIAIEEKAEEIKDEIKHVEEKQPEIVKETYKLPEAQKEKKEITQNVVLQGLEEEDTELLEIEAEEKRLAEAARAKSRDIHITTLEEDKRELKATVGVGGKVKGFLFGGVEISEKDISDLLWELELSLLESDVEQDAASELVKQIKSRLIGQKVNPKHLDEYLKDQIKEILTEMMHTDKIDLLSEVKKKQREGKPLKILMLGPNGAGKTTSIAKLVHYFKKHKLTSIVAAGDTFRAGAIDQIEEHAKRLGIRVIKQQYGADPAAVSFDAIKAAEAGKIDVVIIDSAGRQETNKNLMEELRKIERVAQPDIKLYVGEAYVGQTLLEQVAEFEEIIGIDGFILTKIDTDAKGGTAISLLYKMKKPIVFVGTGQGYDDFLEFTPEFVLERII